MKSLELFAGCGGLALGLERASFTHLALVEWNRHACDTLRLNAGTQAKWGSGNVHQGDVRSFNYEPYRDRVDLLAAGVPCQPFSLAGRHLGDADDRNMFPALLDAVRATAPTAILVENVRGLARQSFRPYLDYILDQLRLPEVRAGEGEKWVDHHVRLKTELAAGCREGLRYRVDWMPVDAADFGVPQRRHRVLIQALEWGRGVKPRWPAATHSRWMLDEAKRDGSYWEEHGIEPPAGAQVDEPRTLAFVGPEGATRRWRTVRDALQGIPPPAGLSDEQPRRLPNHVAIPGARRYPGHDGCDLDEPAKTLKAGVHGVAGGEAIVVLDDGSHRYFSVREAAIVQDFAPLYAFSGSRTECMRQIGNAVPVGLAAAVAAEVSDLLATEERESEPEAATIG